jgi:hypothetical protein
MIIFCWGLSWLSERDERRMGNADCMMAPWTIGLKMRGYLVKPLLLF